MNGNDGRSIDSLTYEPYACTHHTQSVRRVKEANADMRCLSVKLPAVHEDRITRDVWW